MSWYTVAKASNVLLDCKHVLAKRPSTFQTARFGLGFSEGRTFRQIRQKWFWITSIFLLQIKCRLQLCSNVRVSIGVNINAVRLKLTLFSAIPLSLFSLKMSRFFAYYNFEKCALCAVLSIKWNSDDLEKPASSARQSWFAVQNCKNVSVLPIC